MKSLKRWFTVFLAIVLLSQSLPLSALAGVGDPITEEELQQALQIAGLQFANGQSLSGTGIGTLNASSSAADGNSSILLNANMSTVTGGGGTSSVLSASSTTASATAADSTTTYTLEASESGYHRGMKPDETWDAQMLIDWLDDMLNTDIYNVVHIFSDTITRLAQLETEEPVTYGKLTGSAEYAGYLKQTKDYVYATEAFEQEARLLRNRVEEYTVTIEQNTEILLNNQDNLFDSEIGRLSEQIRDATEKLDKLREDIIVLSAFLLIYTGLLSAEKEEDAAYMAWIDEVLTTGESMEVITGKLTPEPVGLLASSTLTGRLSAAAGTSVLATASSQNDFSVQVVDKNQFAVVIHGEDNKPVVGVEVTIKDLNGSAVVTKKTEDSRFGSAVFSCQDFVVDYDQEMELSLTVDGTAVGYRSYYIPWLIMRRGQTWTHVLSKLTDPMTVRESASARESVENEDSYTANGLLSSASAATLSPYVYSCTFNDMDIKETDKVVKISALNDYEFDFAIEVENPGGVSYQAPVLHYVGGNADSGKKQATMSPTSTVKVTATRTKYIYRAKWKQTLYPTISKSERPYFVFPSSGEKIETRLTPEKSKVDQPVIAGTELGSPLQKVFGETAGFNFEIPVIGGVLGLNLPIANYLPTVKSDCMGYVTVTFGSSLVDPKKTTWQNNEQERYDKGMKQYQHNTTLAGQKQKLGTAYKYYKYMAAARQNMTKVRFNLGWFLMLCGRVDSKDEDDGSTYWGAGGEAGVTFVFSFDFTQPIVVFSVPLYVNVNFSASLGVGFSLYCRVLMDKNDNFKDFTFDLSGLTIEIRLALTVQVGLGIKGIASVWGAATGALNVILHFMVATPVHIAVYAQFSVSVGFELFFISYSRVMWSTPKGLIYSNYDVNARRPFYLLMSYAEAEDTSSGQTPNVVQLEPENYPQLAPEATELKSDFTVETLLPGKMQAVNWGGDDYIFGMFQNAKYEQYLGMYKPGETYLETSFKPSELWSRALGYKEYDFDVYNDGTSLHLLATYAKKSDFGEDGKPKDGAEIKLYYTRLYRYFNPDIKGYVVLSTEPIIMEYKADSYEVSPSCYNPHIESVIKKGDNYEIYGTLKGQDDNVTGSQYNLFYINTENSKYLIYGDFTVGGSYGNTYRRAALRSNLRNYLDDVDDINGYSYTCLGFVALDKPREGKTGDSYLILWDYYMSWKSLETTAGEAKPSEKRRPLVLAQGNINSFEIVQTLQSDKKSYSQTIFYTQEETVGDRVENRLKGIYVAPKTWKNSYTLDYEVTYTDYDLSIPATDFKAVTIGSSHYLYWLSTVPKEKETDKDIWRVTAVYYDSATGSFSDEIVVTEFSLPDISVNGTACRAVPENITLTDAGYGYLITRADTGKEQETALPTRVFKFNSNLKASVSLQGVSVMDNVVSQGDFVSADLSVMNDGNMAVGAFKADVVLMKNGVEQGVVETITANLMNPTDSQIVMKDGTVVAKGEQAFYQLKDFIYSPKQHEWMLQSNTKTFELPLYNTSRVTSTDEGSSKRKVEASTVLIPGSLGGYTGNIKIPNDWSGVYDLRVKITAVTTYSSFLAAASLAKKNPELFACDSETRNTRSAVNALMAKGIQRLDYELNQAGDKMVLRKDTLPALMMASTGNLLSIPPQAKLLASSAYAAAAAESSSGEETILLYATEIEAPEPVTMQIEVHDIDVSHRVYSDYYGNDMLEIVIHNYYNNQIPIRLYCTVYEDDSEVGRNFTLPQDQSSITAGKTQTITIPLSSMVDVDKHEKIRVLIRGIGINDETATFNNEFVVYLGGTAEPEPTEAPTIVPVTGDTAHPVLWIGLVLLGVMGLLAAAGIIVLRKRGKQTQIDVRDEG